LESWSARARMCGWECGQQGTPHNLHNFSSSGEFAWPKSANNGRGTPWPLLRIRAELGRSVGEGTRAWKRKVRPETLLEFSGRPADGWTNRTAGVPKVPPFKQTRLPGLSCHFRVPNLQLAVPQHRRAAPAPNSSVRPDDSTPSEKGTGFRLSIHISNSEADRTTADRRPPPSVRRR
jgi:hypothetical protein